MAREPIYKTQDLLKAGTSGFTYQQLQAQAKQGAESIFNTLISAGMLYTSPLTTKGDIFGRGGSDARVAVGSNGQFLHANSSDTEGLDWDWVSTFGMAYFGDGSDGSITLVADTTRAANANVVRASAINLAGYTWRANAADDAFVIYCSGTLTLAGGTITADNLGVAGGTAGTASNGGGAGGAGGASVGSVWVFAKAISGTGTISGKGNNGANGADGTAYTGTAGGGNGGNGNVLGARVFGDAPTTACILAGGGAAAGGTAGDGGTGTHRVLFADILKYIGASGHELSGNNEREFIGTAGGGGGGGAASVNGDAYAGAGGGGGGFTSTTSDAGGDGGTGIQAGSNSNHTNGGGGGGGASGCLAFVFTLSASSGLTVTAAGGDGGNGGSAGVANGSGGAAGGGGEGGVAILICQPSSGATVTAAGGSTGTPGGGLGDGSTGNAGANGGTGIAMTLAISA